MSNLVTNGLTKEEDLKLQELLKKWSAAGGGILSDETFTAIAETVPQICLEIICFRVNDSTGNLETLLLRRPEDDIIWPGKLNYPGKAFRICDFNTQGQTPQESVIKRLEEDELKFSFKENPVFVENLFLNTERGPALVLCYIGKVPDDVKLAKNAVWKEVGGLKEDPEFIRSEGFPLDTVLKFLQKDSAQ